MNIRVLFLPALAGSRFRLTGQDLAFSLGREGRKCVLFSVEEGGQTEWRWVLSQNHCSGQPDGAAASNGDDGVGDGLALFCDAWKRRPLSRAGTPKLIMNYEL